MAALELRVPVVQVPGSSDPGEHACGINLRVPLYRRSGELVAIGLADGGAVIRGHREVRASDPAMVPLSCSFSAFGQRHTVRYQVPLVDLATRDVIDITTPAVVVGAEPPAPVIHVHVPPQPAPVVHVEPNIIIENTTPRREVTLARDPAGRIKSAVVEDA